MIGKLRGGATWAAIFLGTVGALAAADRIPERIAASRGELPIRYRSLADIEGALGVRLGYPFFFPERLEWPPAVLLGRRRPLQTYAEVRERGQPIEAPPTLVIRQWAGRGDHFHAAPCFVPAGGGRLALRGGRVANWVQGRDETGRAIYQARVERGALVTELTARLEWNEFRLMVESLEP